MKYLVSTTALLFTLLLVMCADVKGTPPSTSHVAGIKTDTVKRVAFNSTPFVSARESILKPGEKGEDRIRTNLFVKVESSSTTCYLGEPIMVTYKLYSRLNASLQVTRQPSLQGFTVSDMLEYIPLNETVEKIGGRLYSVHVLKKLQVVPFQSGDLELDPIELSATVHFIKSTTASTRAGNQLHDVIDEIIKEEEAPVIEHATKITGRAIPVSVKPIPETNQPADFNGAVGLFTISSSVSPGTLKKGEPATLKVEITGRGFLPLIHAPVIKWPLHTNTLEVRQEEKQDKNISSIQSRKVFEYTFIPTSEGAYQIPAIVFSFFDPSSQTFNTIGTKDTVLEVIAGKIKNVYTTEASPSIEKSVVTDFIKEGKVIKAVLLLLAISMLLSVKNAYWWIKKRPDKSSPPSLPQTAPAPLQAARDLSVNLQYGAFYAELNNVLWNALTEKIPLPPSELNKTNITRYLELTGWNNDMVRNLHDVLDTCERNIYISGFHTETDLPAILEKADRIVSDLQTI